MIVYKTEVTPQTAEVTALYKKAKLNRPYDDRRMSLMLNSANVIVSAWDGNNLIGLLRGFTDFCFDCYINDLAVDPDYQGQGIGKNLIEQVKQIVEKETLIFLISSTAAKSFYEKLGFKNFSSIDDTWFQVNK